MSEEIKNFYAKTKLEGVSRPDELVKPPVTFTKVFHKRYPRLPKAKLHRSREFNDFERLLRERQSHREFAAIPLSFEDISDLLIGTHAMVYTNGDFERRTYPSAGARFPIELYLVAFNVSGLNEGAYHYDIQNGQLELLLNKSLRDKSEEFVSPYITNAPAVIVLTAVIARSEVKYGDKALIFALLEAGHIAQNIYLGCAALNLGCCGVGGFVNDTVSRTLDLTEDELPLYNLVIGNK